MRILFVGDYSNLHVCLAGRLQQSGHHCVVVSDGNTFMHTHADVPLRRRGKGKVWGLLYALEAAWKLSRLRGFDIVQIINPNFLTLQPDRIRYFYDMLRRNNGRIFLTLASNDYFFVKACCRDELFDFSEFRVGDRPTEYARLRPEVETAWLSPAVEELNRYIYDTIDGAMSVLPEYDMAARPLLGERLTFTNLPVDIGNLAYREPSGQRPLNLFLGMKENMKLEKGTAYMRERLSALAQKHPDLLRLTCVSNLPLTEYLRAMDAADIVIDQLYSYSPATNALQAMAKGKIAVTGGHSDYFRYIGYDTAQGMPLITADPRDFSRAEEEILRLAGDPDALRAMARRGRGIVEEHNNVEDIARLFLKQYTK